MGPYDICVGMVVQLNSGGAPMTVTAACRQDGKDYWGLSGVSRGGLIQEMWAAAGAFHLYTGELTPARPKDC